MKKHQYTPLLTDLEIESIFADGPLYERGSFFVVDKETASYDTLKAERNFFQEAAETREAFLSGHTIIIKNLESFNLNIRLKAASLGPKVDVHMYLVPPGGTSSFPFHTDERDVLVKIVYGEKTFVLQEAGGERSYHLATNDELFIPKGIYHKAIPSGPSCLLSFGIEKPIHYNVTGGIRAGDLRSDPTIHESHYKNPLAT